MSKKKEFTQPVKSSRNETSEALLKSSQDTLAHIKEIMSQPREAKSARAKDV